MNKKAFLNKVNLYVILDQEFSLGRSLEEVALQAIQGGAQMIQFRDKKLSDRDFLEIAQGLKKIYEKEKIPFIINDRVDIALYIDAFGVHLGQSDLPLEVARKILGREKIIGISCHNIEQAKIAEKQGADYLGVGPIFSTTSKEIDRPLGTEFIKEIKEAVKIPFFPIGGINHNNIEKVIQVGASGVAVISAVVSAEDITQAAKSLLEIMKKDAS